MPRIFISYRRDDSAFAAHSIYEKLKDLFGEESITFDVNFSLGIDFAKKIDDSVCRCDVLLAIIGDRWLDIRYADGPMQGQRRLDDPNDWVRLEIASALKKDILVIPVLVGKVSMPDIAPGLPPDLADLTKKVALSVRTGPDLPNDLQLLVRGVKRAMRLSPLTPADLALPPGVKVVPQGLRSFNENDNGFFIYLLPGPYQEDGLPEKLCFWKTRIEATDADTTFRVGLIYGPSGCGKSSLIRAGLLPRLGEHVTAVYVEATATDTEARLLAALQEHCPYLAGESSLLAALRHKDQIPSDKKVLVVLDQFEQYLHSTSEDEQDELAEALRECDGGKLQCILMVRDDFLTPVTRFMKQLDIPLAGRSQPGPGRSIRQTPCQESLGVARPSLWRASSIRQSSERAGCVSQPGDLGIGRRRPRNLRAAGPVCPDVRGQGMETGDVEGDWRCNRGWRGVP